MTDDLNEALDSAVAAATKEVSGEPEENAVPQTEEQDTSTEQEAANEGEAKKAAPAAEPESKEENAEEENELSLSADDLKAINENPLLQKAYKSMQRGLTKKTQGIADVRKQYEEAHNLIEYIKANPDQALEQMAAAKGYVIAKKDSGEAQRREVEQATSDTVDAVMAKWSEKLGPESTKLLVPFVQEIAESIINQTVAPLAERTNYLDMTAKQRGISAAVAEFGAKVHEQGEEWTEEIQSEMAKIMDRVQPGDGTPLMDYLETVYNAVTADRTRRAAVKNQLARLRKAQSEAEPTRSVRPAPKTDEYAITDDMSERDAIAAAVAFAEKQARAL